MVNIVLAQMQMEATEMDRWTISGAGPRVGRRYSRACS